MSHFIGLIVKFYINIPGTCCKPTDRPRNLLLSQNGGKMRNISRFSVVESFLLLLVVSGVKIDCLLSQKVGLCYLISEVKIEKFMKRAKRSTVNHNFYD